MKGKTVKERAACPDSPHGEHDFQRVSHGLGCMSSMMGFKCRWCDARSLFGLRQARKESGE